MNPDHEQRRTLRITIRLSAAEHARLILASERAGLCLSGYVRHTLTDEKQPRSARRPRPQQTQLASILARLGETGVLLRDLVETVRNAARGSHAVLLVERDLSRALAGLAATRNALMGAMGRKVRA